MTDIPIESTASSGLTALRPESWAGEIRVNLIRLIAIVLFYARHLVEVFLSPPESPIRGHYHAAVTAIVVVWAVQVALLHLWLSRRRYSQALSIGAVLCDAFLITLLCTIAGGPATPLVLLYFPLIASASLRLSLPVVYAATVSAMAGYLFLLGYYAWYVIGYHRYYASPQLRIPRSTEIIYLLAMLVTGLMAGQVVRQIKRLLTSGVTIAAKRETP